MGELRRCRGCISIIRLARLGDQTTLDWVKDLGVLLYGLATLTVPRSVLLLGLAASAFTFGHYLSFPHPVPLKFKLPTPSFLVLGL